MKHSVVSLLKISKFGNFIFSQTKVTEDKSDWEDVEITFYEFTGNKTFINVSEDWFTGFIFIANTD